MTEFEIPTERHRIVPASYLVLIKEGKVMLLRRTNTGYEDGNYSLIAGHVDESETFTQALIREAAEEAGIIISHEHLEVAHVMHRNSQTLKDNERVDVFFVARRWDGEPENRETHKCDDLSWFDLECLPDNIIPYIRQAVECINRRINYSEHGW